MDIFKAFAPISKVDDEQRMVYGYASTDTKDSQGDVVKLDAIEKALPDYMRFANIREMHTMSAVGVAKSAEVDEKGLGTVLWHEPFAGVRDHADRAQKGPRGRGGVLL